MMECLQNQSCKKCVESPSCGWHIDDENCIGTALVHLYATFLIIILANACIVRFDQMAYNPPSSTSGAVLFITFVIGATAALIEKIYYHLYRKWKKKKKKKDKQQESIKKKIAEHIRINSSSNLSTDPKIQLQTLQPTESSFNSSNI